MTDELKEMIAPTVALKLGEKEYTLSFSNLSAIKFEQKTGKRLFDLSWKEDTADPAISTALLWSALQDHHPDVTFEQAARLYYPKNYRRVAEAIAQAWRNSMPDPDPNVESQPAEAAAAVQ